MRPSAKSIAVPLSIPAAFLLWFLGAFAVGDVNVHGGTGALVLLTAFFGIAVAIWEAVAIPWAVNSLVGHPEFRTGLNIAAVGAGVLYLCATLWAYVYVTHIGISGVKN
jgi:hypothetical protein